MIGNKHVSHAVKFIHIMNPLFAARVIRAKAAEAYMGNNAELPDRGKMISLTIWTKILIGNQNG